MSDSKRHPDHDRPTRRISMRVILSVTTVALISASLISFGWLAERHTRRALTEEIETRLTLEARNLAKLSVDALLSEYPELTLCPLVNEVGADRPDLAFVVVLDHENRVQGHVDLARLGTEFELLAGLQDLPGTRNLLEGERMLGDEDLAVAWAPARHANGRLVGAALVGLKKDYVDEIVMRPRRSFLTLTAGLLLAGIAITLLLMSHLLRPIAALKSGLERIGGGDLDADIRLKTRSELGELARNINRMAHQLKQSQDEMLEKERLDHEMDLARQIQQSLLPESGLEVGDFVCRGRNRAAAEVGGDWYDYFRLADGRVGMVVADVSGKGLGGCLVTSMLAVLVRSLRDQYESPSDLLVALEREMRPSLGRGTFITIFYGILDAATGHLTFASAAHCPLLVYHADSRLVDEFKTRGVPLGAIRGDALARTLRDSTIELGPGDLVLQYTDGLNEAWNPEQQEQYGFERIKERIAASAGGDYDALLDGLTAGAEAWTGSGAIDDDLTLVVMGRPDSTVRGSAGTARPISALAEIPSFAALRDALAEVPHLTLPSTLDELGRLRPWIEDLADLRDLPGELQMLAESSLYEVCANIIEHGYADRPGHTVDLWWISSGSVPETVAALMPPCRHGAEPCGARGCFLVRDQGEPMQPGAWSPPDLDDPDCRRRGRGLGLQMVHSSMREVQQLPGAPAGNLTLLCFDPEKHLTDKERQDVETVHHQ